MMRSSRIRRLPVQIPGHAGESNNKHTSATSTANRTNPHRQAALNLLDKLFPDQEQKGRVDPSVTVNVPILQHEAEIIEPAPSSGVNAPADRSFHPVSPRQMSTVPVLIMINAGLNLTPEDFRNLVPKGRHMEEWNADQGDILSIIPARDPFSLDRIDAYYLLFKTPRSAAVYEQRATRISRLAWQKFQRPGDLSSEYEVDGENAHDLIRSYTLTPASQHLVFKRAEASTKLGKIVPELIEHGGYPRLMALKARASGRFLVRLNLTGRRLTREQLFTTFRSHERSRNLAWSGTSHSSLKIRQLDTHQFSLRGRPRGREVEPAEGTTSDRTGNNWNPRQSFLVEFETDAQAQAFTRFWHQRTIELPVKETLATKNGRDRADGDFNVDYIEPTTLIEAEYLW